MPGGILAARQTEDQAPRQQQRKGDLSALGLHGYPPIPCENDDMNSEAESPEYLRGEIGRPQVTRTATKGSRLYYHRARRGYRFDLARPRVVRSVHTENGP
jgi:hypothetical protein